MGFVNVGSVGFKLYPTTMSGIAKARAIFVSRLFYNAYVHNQIANQSFIEVFFSDLTHQTENGYYFNQQEIDVLLDDDIGLAIDDLLYLEKRILNHLNRLWAGYKSKVYSLQHQASRNTTNRVFIVDDDMLPPFNPNGSIENPNATKNLLMCQECCRRYDKEEMIQDEISGVTYTLCKHCYELKTDICPICGKRHFIRNMTMLDGELICNECFDKIKAKHRRSIYFCVYCKEWHTKQKFGKNRCNETHWICDYGKDSGDCQVCSVCGMLSYGTQLYTSFCGTKMCYKCWQREEKYLIKAYHNDPVQEFYGAIDGKNVKLPNPYNGYGYYYGVELEVDAGGQRDDISKPTIQLLNDEVYTMRDGSLTNGFEIVTHPHSENALYNMNWEKTFEYLISKGYRSHDINTCGLHLHCNRFVFGDSTEEQRINVCKLMRFVEANYKDFVKLSRREMPQINRWARFYNGELEDKIETIDFYEDIYDAFNRSSNHNDRYRAINLCKKKTIEFRLMRGTLKLDTFLATLDVLITISNNSRNVDIDELSPKKWLDGIKDNTKKYLLENSLFLKEDEIKELKEERKVKPTKEKAIDGRRVVFNETNTVRATITPDNIFRIWSGFGTYTEGNNDDNNNGGNE